MTAAKKAFKEKPFRECTLKYLDETFNLEEVRTLPALEQWLSMSAEISEMEHYQLIH